MFIDIVLWSFCRFESGDVSESGSEYFINGRRRTQYLYSLWAVSIWSSITTRHNSARRDFGEILEEESPTRRGDNEPVSAVVP